MRKLRLIKIVSLLLALLFFLSSTQLYFFRYTSRDELRVDGFRLEEKNSLDVVFLGASELYSGFSPVYAYMREGFTSYPYAVSACPVTLWETMLEEILSRQNPQLIVVEINGACYTKQEQLHNNAPMHAILDRMPLSANKIRSVNRLVDEQSDPKSSFYFPIAKYHDNWKDPEMLEQAFRNSAQQQRRGYALLRGLSSQSRIAKMEKPPLDPAADQSTLPLDEEADRSLRDFLESCQEKHLNVLFTRFPHQFSKENEQSYQAFQRGNTIIQIIGEYDFPFLDLAPRMEEIGIDLNRDFYNRDHMNLYGQNKLTAWLAHELTEDLGLVPGAHEKSVEAEWQESAKYYPALCEYYDSLIASGKDIAVTETVNLINKLDKLI